VLRDSERIPTGLYASPQTPRKKWRARAGFGEEDVLFVCVARFAPQKNHALLLKLCSRPRFRSKAHLVLVGEGILQEDWKNKQRISG